MAIPSLDSYLFATLSLAPKEKTFSINDLMEPIAHNLQISPEDLSLTLSSGASKHKNQIRWSLVFLTVAHLLKRISRGVYAITPEGRHYLKQHSSLSRKDLYSFPEYRRWMKNSGKPKNRNERETNGFLTENTSDNTPEDAMDTAMSTIHGALSSELLEAVKSNSPQFFEQLVVDLMLAMGYGGAMDDAGKAFQTTGDGGIDGVIKEDKLGLSNIYLQAKCWKNTSVGRPEIQAFAGAVIGRHSSRGVFITTSKFSPEAIAYVKTLSQPTIILIDGEKLVQLMIEYGVGVFTYRTYEIKRLDSDYFNEDN